MPPFQLTIFYESEVQEAFQVEYLAVEQVFSVEARVPVVRIAGRALENVPDWSSEHLLGPRVSVITLANLVTLLCTSIECYRSSGASANLRGIYLVSTYGCMQEERERGWRSVILLLASDLGRESFNTKLILWCPTGGSVPHQGLVVSQGRASQVVWAHLTMISVHSML